MHSSTYELDESSSRVPSQSNLDLPSYHHAPSKLSLDLPSYHVQDNTEQHSMEDDTRDFGLDDQFPSDENQSTEKGTYIVHSMLQVLNNEANDYVDEHYINNEYRKPLEELPGIFDNEE